MIHRQDLNSSVLTGSGRVVDYTMFRELVWSRDPRAASLFQLPPGFQALQHLFTDDFVEILEDIHALQYIRDYGQFWDDQPVSNAVINNHQASIQSRLANLVDSSPVVKCCNLAAFLCASMLCCVIWCASVIPVRCPHRLLYTPIYTPCYPRTLISELSLHLFVVV
jgi:hypothetical protein